MKIKKRLVGCGILAATVAIAAPAWAYFSSTTDEASSTVTASTLGAPSGVSASDTSNSIIAVSVTTGPTSPPATGYKVYPHGSTTTSSCTVSGATGSCNATGLSGSSNYQFDIYSTLSNWTSAAFATTANVLTMPDAPTALSLVNGGGSGGSYINSSNSSSISVDVALPSTSSSSDTVHLTASDVGAAHTVTATTQSGVAGGGTDHFTGLDVSSLNDGTITFEAWASNASGNLAGATSSLSNSTYTKDKGAPTGSVTSPPTGQTETGPFSATVSASDTGGSGVASVQLQIEPSGGTSYTNNGSLLTSSPYTGTLVTGGLANGNYNLRAVVTDKAGNTTNTAAITFTLNQPTPTISTTNKSGNTAGKIQSGDTLVLSFASQHQVSTTSLCSGWAGSANITNATVTFSDGGSGTDTLSSITSTTCGGALNIGTFDLGSTGYMDGSGTGTIVFTSSTVAWSSSSKTLTITFGTLSAGGANAGTVTSSAITWTPSSTLLDSNTSKADFAQSTSATVQQF